MTRLSYQIKRATLPHYPEGVYPLTIISSLISVLQTNTNFQDLASQMFDYGSEAKSTLFIIERVKLPNTHYETDLSLKE